MGNEGSLRAEIHEGIANDFEGFIERKKLQKN